MLAEIGIIGLTLTFIAAIYSIFASIWGSKQQNNKWIVSGRNAALLTFPLLLLTAGALLLALITEEYQISYVWSVTDPQTPIFYRITALWGSQQGSLIFWSLTMSLFTSGAIALNWKSDQRLMPYAIAVMMGSLAFFVSLSLFIENPFDRFWIVNGQTVQSALIPVNAIVPSAERLAATSNGLNPLLRHFGMIIHPPMLYLGFVGFVIPFAFAVSALASGDLTTNWIKATRRWSLIAWLFLSLGLILGGRWAYDVLGWGGYWGWDPVENAAFLPWLIGTAFIHSVMIQQKRGMLKVWNMFLVVGAFSAVMFGTFATRSGVIESVHSFARSEIGFPMLSYWAGMSFIAVALILWRWYRGELKDEHQFVGILSRESLFVLNNIIFIALFLVIFWGSFGAPIISELFLDTEITLGSQYFLMVTPPLFLALYILMGVAPLSAWSSTSISRLGRAIQIPALLALITTFLFYLTGLQSLVAVIGLFAVLLAGYVAIWEMVRGTRARVRSRKENYLSAFLHLFSRNQRRYGGYLVHLGITVIGIGVIGSTLFQYETQQTLRVGEKVNIQDYSMEYLSLETGQIADDGRVMQIANIRLYRNGKELAMLRPRIDDYPSMPMTIAGSYSTLENDFYVLLSGYDTKQASFKIYINPLINLVWWGGLILIIGTMVAAWPKEIIPVTVQKSVEAPKEKALTT
ncbi:heme lyase CcmF/NrfE family subunit [Anaerolineales bacterium]